VQAFYDWLRRRPILVDGPLALFIAGPGLSTLGFIPARQGIAFGVFAVALAIPVTLRRAYPAGTFGAVIVIAGIGVFVLPRPFESDLAVVIALYTLAAYRTRRLSIPGLIITLLGCVIAIARWAPAHDIYSAYTLGEVAAVFAGPALSAWLLGDLMHWRRGYYRALEERAARLERERDAHAQIAAAAERARIARELHDVVAHNVSVMVVQADGAGYALESSPERAREALETIARTGRTALAEMRSLLGVLRSTDEDTGELAPQPGIGQVAGLLEQARAAGLPVSFTVEGVPRELPTSAALAAYRIVQESLTNARKHAGPTATAAVTVRFCDEELIIKVTDDGRGTSASTSTGPGRDGKHGADADEITPGHGLVGMRERVEAFGGTVIAGRRPGSGWRVVATLPLAGSVIGAAP
jgi:signal transduction histidine kinase